MEKVQWKPGTLLSPVPAVLVSCGTMEKPTALTIAWTGIICSDPAKTYISVRPERNSYNIIKESGEFVINLTTEKLAYATDYCGVRSGRDVDKCKELGLHLLPGKEVKVPRLAESPVNIECRVTEVKELGSHDMFLAEVVAVSVDDAYMDEKNSFHLDQADPIVYSHGTYYAMGKELGRFGYSVRKKS